MSFNTCSILLKSTETSINLGIVTISNTPFVGSHVPHCDLKLGAWVIQAQTPFCSAQVIKTLLRNNKFYNGVKFKKKLRDHLSLSDKKWELTQIAVLPVYGDPIVHTGSNTPEFAGSRSGCDYLVVGNRLVSEDVIDETAKFIINTKGDLPDRLIAGLEKVVTFGGDRLGHRSCALLVHSPNKGIFGDGDVFMDIRIEDHPNPVAELTRLMKLRKEMLNSQ